MRIAVIGVGGVGGYFGGQLAAAGNDVLFVARNQHLAALRGAGLTIESDTAPVKGLKVNATDDPANHEPADVVLIGVKLWDTDSALELAKPLVGPGSNVISFQNGIVSTSIISALFGPERTLGGVCHIAAAVVRPGVIKHIGKLARITIGDCGNRNGSRLNDFADECQAAGIDTVVSQNIDQVIWEKFVFLSSFSGVTTLLGQPIGAVRSDPKGRLMLLTSLTEATRVAIANGQTFPGDHVDKVMAFIDELPAEMKSSMLVDRERGARLEVRWLSRAVAERGAALGIPTPVHANIAEALEPNCEAP